MKLTSVAWCFSASMIFVSACSPADGEGDPTDGVGTGGVVGGTGGDGNPTGSGGGDMLGTGGVGDGGTGGATGGATGGVTGGETGGTDPGTGASGFCKSFANGSGSTQPCYVGNDGVAYCIADDGTTTALSALPGTAVNATGQNFTTAACAVNDAGAIYCGQYGSMSSVVASGATQVSGSLTGWCALVDGAVKCSGVDGGDAPAVPGTVNQLGCFYHGCCAATTEGKMYCWGDTAALGTPGSAVKEVALPAGKKAIQLGPGQDHICVLLDGGQVQCWGQDWNKQLGGLGESTTTGQTLAASGAIAVVGGQFHTCIAYDDGTVQCSSGGQSEGAGLDAGMLSPVTGITSAVALSAGKHYTCALLSEGDIKCWGRIGGGATPIDVTGPPAAACN